jgi:hypothetical protein
MSFPHDFGALAPRKCLPRSPEDGRGKDAVFHTNDNFVGYVRRIWRFRGNGQLPTDFTHVSRRVRIG